ncbi:Dynactin subunit 4 [Abortiporus biennis]
MTASVQYYCPCLSATPHPPPSNLASSSYSFHPLHSLFFCEECDAVRCNRCVLVEVSGYYCPNCLFEVPSASVRAEKNRCARNCFMCPNCQNTLSVVASDPPDTEDSRSSPIVISTVGEPPFFLYCNHCRWDSAEVGITFEKPTGLAAQLQKFEDMAPESLEFERLKEYYEPQLPAASSALHRSVSGVPNFNGLSRSRSSREKGHRTKKEEESVYSARVEAGSSKGLASGSGGDADVDFLKHLETVSEVAALEQRWVNSWTTSLHTSDLKPFRIPLHSKKSKRCPSCRHILIKPEQKAQSVKYKIKLVAANYLPAINVTLPHAQAAIEMIKRSSTMNRQNAAAIVEEHSSAAAGNMLAGKTYPFHLAFTNPLYDPIQVRLHVQRAVPASDPAEKTRRPPFAVTLPSSAFTVNAYTETWGLEEEDDDDMFGGEDDEFDAARSGQKDAKARGRNVAIIERRANITVIGGEVMIAKEAKGNVKFNMLVTYTYRSDDPEPTDPSLSPSKSKGSKAPEIKTFSFYTVVELGKIVPREEPKPEAD